MSLWGWSVGRPRVADGLAVIDHGTLICRPWVAHGLQWLDSAGPWVAHGSRMSYQC